MELSSLYRFCGSFVVRNSRGAQTVQDLRQHSVHDEERGQRETARAAQEIPQQMPGRHQPECVGRIGQYVWNGSDGLESQCALDTGQIRWRGFGRIVPVSDAAAIQAATACGGVAAEPAAAGHRFGGYTGSVS